MPLSYTTSASSIIGATYEKFTSGEYNLSLQKRNYDTSIRLDDTCLLVQENILCKLFGEVMYLDFIQNLTSIDNLELINGYKVNGVITAYGNTGAKRVYFGLKDMLAYFTYHNYMSNQFAVEPQQEGIKLKQKDGKDVNPEMKIIRAFNLGVKLYYDAKAFIEWKKSNDAAIFPDYSFTNIDTINSFYI